MIRCCQIGGYDRTSFEREFEHSFRVDTDENTGMEWSVGEYPSLFDVEYVNITKPTIHLSSSAPVIYLPILFK